MNAKKRQSIEKLNGMYYTPVEIVKFLSNWAEKNGKCLSVLEPSAGNGRFVYEIHKLLPKSKITAVEIDSEACSSIKSSKNIEVINDDFYKFYDRAKDDKKYDLVIGNPPYIRYQYLSSAQREYQSNILKRNGLKPNKLVNAWVAFTVAALELLEEGGIFAFVIPTDIFQVSYAKQLRKFLFENIEIINIVTFDEVVFDDTQQDVALIFGKKVCNEKVLNSYRSINVKNLNDLNIKIENLDIVNYSSGEKDKWTELKLNKNIRDIYHFQYAEKTVKFNDYATASVGITTGNNKFFAVNQMIINKYELEEYAVPLLGRSVEVDGLIYDFKDLRRNIDKNQNVWLLNFNGKKLNEGAINYIKYGEKNGQNLGYKLGLREKWYEVPSIWNPDAFVLRRMGAYPKLIKNNIAGTSTDTFHRIVMNFNKNIYELLVLFYSSVSMLSIELESRSFGGGALEILPGDFKNIRLPKLNKTIDFKEMSHLLDEKLRSDMSIEEIVKWVDTCIMGKSFFSSQDTRIIYDTWVELKNKRINK